MKVLVTAASRYGATEEIAQAVADELRAYGHDAVVQAPDAVNDVRGYDAVVLGSAVYAGRWLKPARELVERTGRAWAGRPVWLFSSGPIGDPLKPAEDPDVAGVMAATGARGHAVFAGRLVRNQLRFGDRAIAAALRAPDGDFRDWDAIRAWAASIAEELAANWARSATR